MGLILSTTFKGKEAVYFGKHRIEYDKGSHITTFYVYLYWDKASADASPTDSLAVHQFSFAGLLTVAECYAEIKLLEEFEGAEDDL